MFTSTVRPVLSRVAESERVRDLIQVAPVSRSVVARFVPGEGEQDAVDTAGRLVGDGLAVSLDRLGEDVTDRSLAQATRDDYLSLLTALSDAGLTGQGRTEVSLKLSALGQSLPDGGALSLDLARDVVEAAAVVDTTVTVDMEDHTTTDATLAAVTALRADFPDVGAVLQSYLRRTEADCRDLSGPGSRVRLCKGAYDEPESVAFTGRHEVDLSFVRCLKVLMAGEGVPMVATHDPRLIDIATMLASVSGRAPGDYEFQMLFGIRPHEQERLAAQGHTMRVYTPYGQEWYGYLMRRLAERPANTAFFLRSLLSKG